MATPTPRRSGMDNRSPDVKYVELRARPSSPAALEQDEPMSRGEPQPKKGARLRESALLGSKTSGPLRMFSRIQDNLRSRGAVKQSGRRSVYAVALGCISKLASWIHALWLTKKTAENGLDVRYYYDTLCSDEEWSTSVTAAELSLDDSSTSKDVLV